MKKRKSFFDDVSESDTKENCVALPENTEISRNETVLTYEEKKQEAENEDKAQDDSIENDDGDVKDVTASSCTCKRKNTIIFSLLALIIISFAFVSIAYGMGLFNGKYSNGTDADKDTPKEEFYFYPADYETDIFTIPEYLALDRRIKYAPDSSQSYLIQNGDYAAEGEPGLIVIGEYLNAVIAGNHEKVNSLFTDKYLEENQKHERFPPQKLFGIKIRKVRQEIKDTGESVYQFMVSYKIFRNDGLFRNNVDETREHAQKFEIIVYPDDSGKINLIEERPGYVLDI